MPKGQPLVAKNPAEANKALTQLDSAGVEYLELKRQDGENKVAEDAIKADAMTVIRQLGTADAKGNIKLETDHVSFELQRRVSLSLVDEEDAIALLTKKKILDKCLKTSIDLKAIQDAYVAGELTDADVNKLVEEKEIFAFIVKPKGQ